MCQFTLLFNYNTYANRRILSKGVCGRALPLNFSYFVTFPNAFVGTPELEARSAARGSISLDRCDTSYGSVLGVVLYSL